MTPTTATTTTTAAPKANGAVKPPTTAELLAKIAQLEAAVAAKPKPFVGISLKASEKGAVSAYGLGRFPVTLYQEQWTRLLDHAEKIRDFIAANQDKLTRKGEGQ